MAHSNSLIPLEILAASYRTTTHQTERDLRAIIRKLIDCKNTQNKEKEPLLQMLSKGKEELLSLKRKLSQKFQQQYTLYDNCKKRIHRHEELKQDNEEKVNYELNYHVIQYLHSRGEFDKAKKLAQALNEENMFQLETSLLERAQAISQDILCSNLGSLKQWIGENSHNLDKNESTIFFQLACCEFISFDLDREATKACHYLRQQLKSMRLNKGQHKIVEKLGYLLIDPISHSPNTQAYLKTLQATFLKTLQATFRKVFSDIYQVTFDSQLERNLIVGISSLKTICCCKAQTKNPQKCPICAGRTSQLADRIPMLTKQSSSLKCRINQTIMDEENYPIALPSGNIYSITGLNSTCEHDQYYCINTETWYPKNQAKKVFLA